MHCRTQCISHCFVTIKTKTSCEVKYANVFIIRETLWYQSQLDNINEYEKGRTNNACIPNLNEELVKGLLDFLSHALLGAGRTPICQTLGS